MINTEVCLYVKRAEIELEHVHQKLRLLLALTEDNGVEDCIDTTEKMLEDARESAKSAAKNIDNWGSTLWLRLYRVEEEQKAAAAAEVAMATTTIVVEGKDAAEQAHLNDALNAWDQAREANDAAIQSAPSAECKGCGCDNEELADYGCAGCTCSKADEAEGGELNG